MLPIPRNEAERIAYLKAILISYANHYDAVNGGYTAIQAVQRMAGESTLSEYLSVIYDGIHYGNWPWILNELKKG